MVFHIEVHFQALLSFGQYSTAFLNWPIEEMRGIDCSGRGQVAPIPLQRLGRVADQLGLGPVGTFDSRSGLGFVVGSLNPEP